MESYGVGSIQQGFLQYECSGRSQSNGGGSYGLSIRVQGIGGHPYVVLNNRERDHSPPRGCQEPKVERPSVGYQSPKLQQFGSSHIGATDIREPQKMSSTLLNFQRHPEILQPYDPEKNSLDLDGFPTAPSKPSSGDLSPPVPHTRSFVQDKPILSVPDELHKRSPEQPVLREPFQQKQQPQTPSVVELKSQALPLSRPEPQPRLQRQRQSPASGKVLEPAVLCTAFQESVSQGSEYEDSAVPSSAPQGSVPEGSKDQGPSPQVLALKESAVQDSTQGPASQRSAPTGSITQCLVNAVPATHGSLLKDLTPQGSMSQGLLLPDPGKPISSANSSLERHPCKPDVLPLRRLDSSGSVLQSPTSSLSSASPSSTYKRVMDDHSDSLLSDPINRHQNRRYIPFLPGTGRDIDTGSIPAVDELIDKFDGKNGSHQRRGRTGRRNRINPEDRKRSRSVDSAFPFGMRDDTDQLEQFGRSRSRCKEHVILPSQLRQHKGPWHQVGKEDPPSAKLSTCSTPCTGSTPSSPQGTILNGTSSFQGYKRALSRSSTLPLECKVEEEPRRVVKVLSSAAPSSPLKALSKIERTPSSERDVQATPDLLKGPQELSQQTNEETAKQILFNYLKDGSSDNDDTTKRKVNLVFEKIQTLKSRAAGNVQGDNQPPEAGSQVKDLQDQRSKLENEVVDLKKKVEEETRKQNVLSKAQEKACTEKKELQRELTMSQDECVRLREQLTKVEEDLRITTEELFQVKMEKEKFQTEIRDLQEQLSEMHDELDGAKRNGSDSGEKEAMFEELMHLKMEFQELLQVKEEQEELLRRRERELTALKGALKDEVATHDREVDTLREQYEQEIHKLLSSMAGAKQSSASSSQEMEELEAARGAAEGLVEKLRQECDNLRCRVQELESEVVRLSQALKEAKDRENQTGNKMDHLENENKQLEESLAEVREQEEAMSRANRALATRLEDVQRNLTKLTQDHRELNEKLREEKVQKEQFERTKNEIEDERRLLDRTVEKLQKEMCEIVEVSQNSTQDLQVQIDKYKERNLKEMTELQRQLQDRTAELDNTRAVARKLKDELSHVEDDLRQCKMERDEAVLKVKCLEQKIFDLEIELQSVSHPKDERSRQIKLMEDRISQLQMDLEEERNSGDLLMDRVDQSRQQVEQMRNELLQERAARQDLECDKVALERQNKDLRSRVAHLEGSQKSNKEGLVSQLEGRIHMLEERLEAEERDHANLQLVNRRLERKVKEVMMQVDEEHHSLQDQKDQLNLRLKALKRQMSEAEEEIDRLEHGKKKLQRDLEEQHEANEQLRGQMKTLRSEMRRKNSTVPPLDSLDDEDDDDNGTDGEVYYRSASGYRRSSQDPTA